MLKSWRAFARRILVTAGASSAAGALAVWLAERITGRVDWARASSHGLRTAFIFALLSVASACVPWRRAEWRQARRWRRFTAAGRWVRSRAARAPWLPWTPAALVALVGVAQEVLQWADARPLWLDEEMIALNLRDRSAADLAGALWLGQSAPFGWLMLQRAALLALGTHEPALRLLPVLFGVATLAVAFWVGRRFLGPVGAFVLLLLCSFGQWMSYYALELKHYSADTFWALLLPALAAWAMEGTADGAVTLRRFTLWWVWAAVGQWFSNGGLLVAPACALLLVTFLGRHGRWRAAWKFSLVGLLWLSSFGLHYLLALRHTLGSGFLRDIWSFALPPASGGPSAVVEWFAEQLEPLAAMPGGTGHWLLFWSAASLGLALARRPALGAAFATVPLSAFVLSALRIVPLHGRLFLWVVPALYVGIALLADVAASMAEASRLRGKWLRAGLAAATGLALLPLCVDVFQRGRREIESERPASSKHRLDDRSAVGWLMQQRQPGDALMTTELGRPAVWWYGGIPISDPSRGSVQSDGAPVLVVAHSPSWRKCRHDELPTVLRGRSRVLVYLGFRYDDVPRGFDTLLIERLSELGSVEGMGSFAQAGRAWVVDLRDRPDPEVVAARRRAAVARDALDGCITVREASR